MFPLKVALLGYYKYHIVPQTPGFVDIFGLRSWRLASSKQAMCCHVHGQQGLPKPRNQWRSSTKPCLLCEFTIGNHHFIHSNTWVCLGWNGFQILKFSWGLPFEQMPEIGGPSPFPDPHATPQRIAASHGWRRFLPGRRGCSCCVRVGGGGFVGQGQQSSIAWRPVMAGSGRRNAVIKHGWESSMLMDIEMRKI
jgi:hypothetical protein